MENFRLKELANDDQTTDMKMKLNKYSRDVCYREDRATNNSYHP